jgi:hypothetical protein
MSLSVIGFGVGRTGTFSLKLALEQLGFDPCHHMEEVGISSAAVGHWKVAAGGTVDWNEAYAGYRAAVDWPTAAFCEELTLAFPDAKFLLTVRDAERWYRSYSSTIARLVQTPENAPPELLPFLDMVSAVMRKTGFRLPASKEAILEAYERHVAFVRATIAPERLLVFDVAEGWDPLCTFLGVPVPTTPFPRTNTTQDFWDSIGGDLNGT